MVFFLWLDAPNKNLAIMAYMNKTETKQNHSQLPSWMFCLD